MLSHISTPVGVEVAPIADCLFADDLMDLFRTKHYRLQATITGSDNSLLPITIVHDTEDGPHFVIKKFYVDICTSAFITNILPRLRAAGNEPIFISKFIPLQVQLGNLSVRVWFGILKRLAVNVLMGSPFLYSFIASISLVRQLVELVRFSPYPSTTYRLTRLLHFKTPSSTTAVDYVRRAQKRSKRVPCPLSRPHNKILIAVFASPDILYYQSTLRRQYS